MFKLPRILCIILFMIEIIVLFMSFNILGISYMSGLGVFVYGTTANNFLEMPFVIAGYAISFILALVNSVLFLNVFK